MMQWTGGSGPVTLGDVPAGGAILPGEVHVWCLEPPLDAESPALYQFKNFTSGAERERAQRFHFAADCWSYISSQALLRWALGRQLGMDPASLQFRRSDKGRPFLEDESPDLHFSMTHSRALVAVAISREKAVGVDTEQVGREANADELAQSYFTPAEVAYLKSFEYPQRADQFFIQWTLKESFLKAIGMGLHAPLDTLEVIPRDGRIEFAFHHAFDESPKGWRFWAAILRGHHLAVAVRSDRPEISIRLGWAPRFWSAEGDPLP